MSLMRRTSLPGLLVVAAACQGPMSMFSDDGPLSSRIENLTWFLIIAAAVVYAGVMLLMWRAASRNRPEGRNHTDLSSSEDVDLSSPSEKGVILGGFVFPAVVLTLVFVVAMGASGRFPAPISSRTLSIKIIGHQWWWEVEYQDPSLPETFSTANEIHIPVGHPVRMTLISADVIHSFWVPRLQGKIDLIPGDTNEIRLMADKAGTYRGQCAEFCGKQHAHMAFAVVAEAAPEFEAWERQQRMPALEPVDTALVRGKAVFMGAPCALCHAVRGTGAGGKVAPDLTHVGSRGSIAAGTLPNTVPNLEAWITHAQAIKPGARMPSLNQFNGPELNALAKYVKSLK